MHISIIFSVTSPEPCLLQIAAATRAEVWITGGSRGQYYILQYFRGAGTQNQT